MPLHPDNSVELREFADRVREEFSASPEYAGYDPNEDPCYFVAYLLERLYQREGKEKADVPVREP
jgi:hypothetical protein